jgi:hypothetical protein
MASSLQPRGVEISKESLLNVIAKNYPHLLTLLKPIVHKFTNDVGRNVLAALRKRHSLLVKNMKRIQE